MWLTDGVPVLNPANPKYAQTLAFYSEFADSVKGPPRFIGMETAASIRARMGKRFIFTDDNMGWEWRSWHVQIPWH